MESSLSTSGSLDTLQCGAHVPRDRCIDNVHCKPRDVCRRCAQGASQDCRRYSHEQHGPHAWQHVPFGSEAAAGKFAGIAARCEADAFYLLADDPCF